MLVFFFPQQEHIALDSRGVSWRNFANGRGHLGSRRIDSSRAADRHFWALRPRWHRHHISLWLLPGRGHEALSTVLLENLTVMHVVVDVIVVSVVMMRGLLALLLLGKP